MLNIKSTVYVVDDDENVRKSLAQLIDAVGYNIKIFPSAKEFLDSYDFSSEGSEDIQAVSKDG